MADRDTSDESQQVLPPLTEKQLDLLTYIAEQYQRKRLYPTQREIAEHFNITQAAVSSALRWLEKKGYIKKIPGERRNTRLTQIALEKLTLEGRGAYVGKQISMF